MCILEGEFEVEIESGGHREILDQLPEFLDSLRMCRKALVYSTSRQKVKTDTRSIKSRTVAGFYRKRGPRSSESVRIQSRMIALDYLLTIYE